MTATMIPLVNLKRQHVFLEAEISEAIAGVIAANAFIGGKEVTAFEDEFAHYCGTDHCVGVANGTDALIIALTALGVGRGDQVVTTATSYFATAEAIGRVGAEPIFCDIDPDTAIFDIGLLEQLVTSSTKAIVVVHLYGRPAQMDHILDVAQRRGLFIIEDCAQAAGATFGGKRVGSLGDIGCYSFYPSKNLGAMGDAGAIVTNNQELALKCRKLANHGGIERYEHGLVGFNSRLDGLQAAILRIKLAHLDEWNQQRKKIVRHYRELLDDPHVDHLTYPENEDHVHHLFVVRVSDRDQLMHDMHGLKIGTAVHYPVPLPFLPPYGESGFGAGDFPQASQHAKTAISLPIFPLMKEEEVRRVAEALKKLANAKS